MLSFLFFLIVATCGVGFLAARYSRRSEEDYFLASQSVSPYVLAFSGSASKFSGFMFSGFMAMAYVQGTAVIYLAAGLWAGGVVAYALSLFRLQELSRGGWALSLGELMTFWGGENRLWLRRAVGVITLIFLSIYAAAQMKAGGRALEVALDQPFFVGVILSTVIILFYCWAGGIRASIWTDSAQMGAMVLSIVLILVVAMSRAGGPVDLWQSFLATAPLSDEVSLTPSNLSIGGFGGLLLFFLGSFGFGFACIGQPHVLVRAMALGNRGDAKKFFITTCLFEALFLILFTAVGLATRVIMQDSGDFNAELSLFLSAEKLLPSFAVGFVLAGVFSATMSTADSQIISCSASLMRDLPEPPKQSLILAKAGTVTIALLATLIALFIQESIFSLVTFAFAGLGASIGSVLLLRLLNVDIPEWGALIVLVSGGSSVVLWKILGLNSYLHESLPGFGAALLAFVVVKFLAGICRSQG